MSLAERLKRFGIGWPIIHFGLSSCGCLLIDKGVFTLILLATTSLMGRGASIMCAITVARLISGNCNYFYNQRFVFGVVVAWRSYWQYWSLCLVNISLSIGATEALTALLDVNGLAITVVNICVDVCLFLFSFSIQRFFIFRKRSTKI